MLVSTAPELRFLDARIFTEYEGTGEEEEYIDLVPILQNLNFDVDKFLKPIQKVRIKYD